MKLLIDPPVSPYSKPADIQAWLDRLAELRDKDPEAVARAEKQARGWLELATAAEKAAKK